MTGGTGSACAAETTVNCMQSLACETVHAIKTCTGTGLCVCKPARLYERHTAGVSISKTRFRWAIRPFQGHAATARPDSRKPACIVSCAPSQHARTRPRRTHAAHGAESAFEAPIQSAHSNEMEIRIQKQGCKAAESQIYRGISQGPGAASSSIGAHLLALHSKFTASSVLPFPL